MAGINPSTTPLHPALREPPIPGRESPDDPAQVPCPRPGAFVLSGNSPRPPPPPIDTHAILAVATGLGVVYHAATHGRGICTIKVSDYH
ncbi:hypothetical protein OG496_01510 [Streptomyces sp. NBC_00988]|uniref:hypothetical protein n=1 Tax=Streptomyces sp. NBC_00988 TaxID=2903704 RepID=UPI003867CBF8|nr:hypothetical protein OG496_01510 [Streptomyces sp. NBC_00988]